MSYLDEDLGDTLALTNAARQAFGLNMLTELLDSKPGDASDCLFYRALDGLGCTSVDGNGDMVFEDSRKASYIGRLWGTRAVGQKVKAPAQFARVIQGFDSHKVTHYETQKPRNF